VYFGYPIAGEDDAVRATHAALTIVEEIRHLGDASGGPFGLQVRIGLATGRVTIGMLDSMSIAGATPNLAARIQAEAKPGQVLMAPATRRIAGAQFEYEDLGVFTLKGFADPVRISAVTRAHGFSSRSAWRGRDNVLPMVGRDADLAELQRIRKCTDRERPAAVLLLADAGLGKSRMATAVATDLQDEPHLAIRLQCSPFHTNSVLHPFAQHLTAAAGFARNDSALEQAEKLETQLAIAGVTEPQDLALVAALLDIKVENRYPPLEMPPPARLQMTQDVLLRYFAALAGQTPDVSSDAAAHYSGDTGRGKPLLLIFEDLHWVDPSSLELLEKLLASGRLRHSMILLTARTGFAHAFKADVTQIELQKLDPLAARQMVANLCSAVALPEAAVDHILKVTEGIPLFIEEMTRIVQDAQATRVSSVLGSLGATGMGVPDTLLDLLMERLDRLGPAKDLAQTAAVLGQECPEDLLSAVAQMDASAFQAQLAALLESGLVLRLGGNQLKFKHALVETTAYDSILLKTRVALHGRVVACLQEDFAALAQGAPQLLAHHLARANRALEASRYLLEAGVQALQAGAPREAAEHLKEGLAALKDVPAGAARSETELSLLSVLGPTTMVLMGPGSADFGAVQKRAYALCAELPGMPRRFPITYGLALHHWGRAEFEIAQRLARQLLESAEAADTIPGVGREEAVMAACNMNGMIAYHMGESAKARAHLERSVSLYQPERDAALYPVYLMDFGVFGRFYLALACVACGDPEAARRHAWDAYSLAQSLNQPHSVGFSLLANLTVAALLDEPDTAHPFAEQCVEFSTQHGFPEFIGMARVVRGWAAARFGHAAQGLDDLEQGFLLWQRTGFEPWQSWFTCLKADILRDLGKHEQASVEIEAALARNERNKELQFRTHLLSRRRTIST
jgi:tetratricopeptide (TPR) repeat protein